jgi:hypothetical protein
MTNESDELKIVRMMIHSTIEKEKVKLMATKTVFRKGSKAATGGSDGSNGVFVRVKEDESLSFVPLTNLEDMISVDQHEYWDVNPALIFPCLGAAKCPACKSGHKPKYKGFLGVLANGEAEAKILPFGLMVERQLVEIGNEIGDIKGNVFKLRRTGSGLSTKYTVVGVGKKVDVSATTPLPIEDHINVLTVEEITEKIAFFAEDEPVIAKKATKEDGKVEAGGWEEV